MNELVGVWRLVSFLSAEADADPDSGPLGASPDGLLVYTATGHVTVNMMRTDGEDGSRYMSYAGTWRRERDRVVHTISVAPERTWIGSEQVRDLELSGDRLLLSGRGPSGKAGRSTLEWRRVTS
ncbi:lipocalin-like domain-containing protein [Streptomyces sp. NPDC059454]|uniref:lipocalin-like domain-containing protein n=1 Tax=Streptomyces sp. NPDC059454 TaxID=3346836 RepID=UPI0036CA1CA4